MKKLIILFFTTFIFAHTCENKVFNLSLLKDVSFKKILVSLSNECNLNIIVKDKEAYNILNSNISLLSVKDATLEEFLDILFSSKNLFYKLKGDKVIIKYYDTKVFKVDYVNSALKGSSELNATDGSVSSSFSFDFWQSLKDNIDLILKNTASIYKNYSDTKEYVYHKPALFPDNDKVNDKEKGYATFFYKEPVIDKNAGLVTVTGTKKQLREVKKYIESLNKRLHKEVFLDVKIYSVYLKKSYSTGIDWSQFSIEFAGSTVLNAHNIIGKNSVFKTSHFNESGFLNFLSNYGVVNAVSNPKIVTLNNQKALISVGDTIYYPYYTTQTDQNGNIIQTKKFGSVFVGVLLDVVPQISDSGVIILRINPRINSVRQYHIDMPPDTVDNKLMSVVRIKDNQTLVLGGLITSRNDFNVNGVNVLKEIPIIKHLFSSKNKESEKRELVFVITPHIIDLNKKTTFKSIGYKRLPTLEELNVE